MHFKNEGDFNNRNACTETSASTKSNSTTTSCSSSTDSGVILIDNQNNNDTNIIINDYDNDSDQEMLTNQDHDNYPGTAVLNNCKNNYNTKDPKLNNTQLSFNNNIGSSGSSCTTMNPEKNLNNQQNNYKKKQQNQTSGNDDGILESPQKPKQNQKQLDKSSKSGSLATDATPTSPAAKRRPPGNCSPQTNINKLETDGPNIHFTTTTTTTTATAPGYSPSLSIRSTTISIGSIDENAEDSSIVDSDSDQDADAEGVHSTYIVKKLGQQTDIPPYSDELTNLNKGLKVVGQTIHPNGFPNIGPIADKMVNGNLCLPNSLGGIIQPVSPPQIGSVALTNSSDVTFGDKHFYEGPVTIQQFLIDSRGKAKGDERENGEDNPAYAAENGLNGPNNAPKSGSAFAGNDHHYQFFNQKAFIIKGAIVLLTIIVGVVILTTTSILQTPMADDGEDVELSNGTLKIITKAEWGGKPAKNQLDQLQLPVHWVIISHTASDTCHDKMNCAKRCQVVQGFHMDSLNWDDIGYNFLIGGDGLVYEGRGWDNQGAHTKGYNSDSVGISFIGTFEQIKPTAKQLLAGKLLIAEGVRLNKLAQDYKLFAHRQLSATQSPGDILFGIIQKWPHFSKQIV